MFVIRGRALNVWHRRQLKHGRMLTFTQPREQHDLPAGKFERVSMRIDAIADITEAGQVLAELLFRKKGDRALVFDLGLERQFGTRRQAYRNVRLANRGEPARDRIREARQEGRERRAA